MSDLVYLASPYSHDSQTVREMRFKEACRAAGRLMREGHCVFSPIAHSHSVEQHFPGGDMEGHVFWLQQDFAVLRHASKLLVLMLEGWEASRGVAAEIELARRLEIPIQFIEPRP